MKEQNVRKQIINAKLVLTKATTPDFVTERG